MVYFLKANFASLRNPNAERAVLIVGSLLILALIAIVMLFPDVPSIAFNLAYILIARHVVAKHQVPLRPYEFHSNWSVLGLGLLCLLGSMLLVFAPMMGLVYLGIG